MLARHQCIRPFPANTLEVEQVPQEDRFVLQYIESVAAKAAALGNDHSLCAALRSLQVGLEVVRRVEKERGIAVRRSCNLAGPCEIGASGSEIRARRNDSLCHGRVE